MYSWCVPWELAMDRFIHDENLKHYQRLLQRTTDPVERERIRGLMAEEEAKSPPSPPNAAPDRLPR